QTQTKNAGAASSSSSSNSDVSVRSFSLKNGTMVIGRTGGEARSRTYDPIDIKASDLSYTTQFPFDLSARTPGNGTIKLTGKAGPLNPQDSAATPLNARFEIK